MTITTDECAREILDVTPLIMRTIRTEMRRHRAAGLSVPQFRALVFLNSHPGGSLTRVAGYLGLTLPSTSKMMDGLVTRQLVTRLSCAEDRRKITLNLTEAGQVMLAGAYQAAHAYLAEKISALEPEQKAAIFHSMQALRPIFTLEDDPVSEAEK